MPTHLPRRRPEPSASPGSASPLPAASVLASAWLAGTILLVAALGAETRGTCAPPAPVAVAQPVGTDAAAALLRDMLGHD